MKNSVKIFAVVGVILALVVCFCLYTSLSNRSGELDTDVTVLYVGMTEGDYTYTVYDNYTCKITDYSGSAINLKLPARINACPVVGIGDEAFENCDTLVSVTLPDTVTFIEEYAFSECALLKKVRLPASLCYVGDYAFYKSDLLEKIRFPGTVTRVGDYAFAGCESLASVVFASGVEEIGDNAFESCISLEKLRLGKGLSTLGNYAFSECRSLKSVKLSEGALSVGIRAFNGCSALEEISLPSSLASVGRFAFEGTPWRNNAKGIVVAGEGILVAAGADVGPDVVIPEGVRYIGDAFENRSDITSLTFSSTVETVGDSAFKGCTGLKAVIIPENVTRISSYAFYGCEALKSVSIPASLCDFGNWCFTGTAWAENGDFVLGGDGILFGCNVEGEEVSVPEGVKYIAEAFYESEYKSVALPQSVEKICNNAFSGSEELETVVFAPGLLSLGEKAFYNCGALESVALPQGVETVGKQCFFGCDGIKTLSLPASLIRVEEKAFDLCTGVDSVVWPRAEEAVVLEGNEVLTQEK